ncbi:MAG: aminotransferase class V-fold PLP-dependent enzyme [Anaerolineae bacterium]
MTNMNNFDLAKIRADFPIVDSTVYVNHAAVGPIPLSVRDAIVERADMHVYHTGTAWEDSLPLDRQGRKLAAELVNSRPERIAWIQNTSDGVSKIANGLDWRPGDNVIVPDREFPSNYFSWKKLANQGVELRHIESEDGKTLPKNLLDIIDENTKVVALSQVQYYNGFHCNIEEIGKICRGHSALLVVDGTQSIGAINLDVVKCNVDALIVSAHKWMMGPLGIGFMALSDQAMKKIAVTNIGWLSFSDPFNFVREKELLPNAGRFEPGTENSTGIYGLTARLKSILEIGPNVIEQRIIDLTDQLCAGLEARGYQITSHRGPSEKSGIVTFTHPVTKGVTLMERLTQQNIAVSLRAGGIRVSPHYYNSEDEIDLILSVLE